MNEQILDSSLAPPEQRPTMMLAHLLGFFFGVIGTLIYWLINKDKNDQPFVQDQAREALNFQLNVFGAAFISGVLMVVLIGFLLLPLVVIATCVLSIYAAVKAYGGESFRYPLIIRLIQ